jgi:putative addiction module component (TIGR02574 family)
MTLRDQIAEQALTLPPEDRAFLADLLEESLTGEGFATPELAAEWAAEIKRRVEAYHRGETPAYDAQTAIQWVRKKLEERRSGTAG